MKNRVLLSIIISVWMTSAYAFQQGWSDFSVGLGSLTHQAGKIATEVGETSLFEFRPVLAASYRYELTPTWSFIPEGGLTLPETSEDETHSTFYSYLNVPIAWHYEYWTFRFGPGFFFTRISGKGGTMRLQNGTSFDEFPVPDGSAATRNLTYNLGAEATFDPEWSARIDFSVLKLFDSEKRAVNHLLTINYHFGAIL